ncbi:hypothetical protein [Biformimicrobium ophioploci]|nr:hypothetical protein [Microbulbifer sp. NKW57]
MSGAVSMVGAHFNRHTVFKLFKYAIYLLLSYNVYGFFVDEHAAALQLYPEGVPAGELITKYRSTIDTLAWVVLLLVFELETYVLSDERITGWVKAALNTVSAICYAFIVYAFLGYVGELRYLSDLAPLAGSACDLVAQGGWSVFEGLDEYSALTAQNCGQFAEGALRIQGEEAIGTAEVFRDAQLLAWVDVINAGVWLLIVAILAFEVWSQLAHHRPELDKRFGHPVKAILYLTLLGCAVYWGFEGSFLDFWDAFLWLVAFFFIEMNIFEWQEESKEALVD